MRYVDYVFGMKYDIDNLFGKNCSWTLWIVGLIWFLWWNWNYMC